MFSVGIRSMSLINVGLFAVIAISSVRVAFADGEESFCSQVQSMHRQCQVGAGSTILTAGRVGKAGPKGDKGERGGNGRSAEVDYSVIDGMLQARLEDVRVDVEREIASCNRKLDLLERKIEKFDQKLKALTMADCRRVSLKDAETASGNGGVFNIYVEDHKIKVFCDLNTDGGGWTVFQRRMDGSEDFYRGWDDYVQGFGNLTGEFWLGLDAINLMTTSRKYELRVDLEAWDQERRYAKYSSFSVGDASTNYTISISGYSGTASDSITGENGRAFSTKDRDQTPSSCARRYKGAWWYGACHSANLNGLYSKTGAQSPYGVGINWRSWKGYTYSMKFVEMKIRPSAP